MGLKPIKVSQLNNYIKRILQTDPILGNISVIGEISNLKFHSSGHVYFSLKDETSKVSCFLASSNVNKISCSLEEGMEVTATGYIYLYERGGSYSINIKDIEETGQGELAVAFQKLKDKLEKKGYFDKKHKKEIPPFPEKIAVVTSSTGAAIQDILKIITSKNNYVDVLIYPVLVQGPAAAADIAAAIDDLNMNYPDIDTIITGRGGGSMEELWAFNEEIVAESIFKSKIPIISAVGHETDFTIADFVSDLRAETPTAAANAAVPDTNTLRDNLDYYKQELARNLIIIMENKKARLEKVNMQVYLREIQGRSAHEQLRADNIIREIQINIDNIIKDYVNRVKIAKESLEAANPKKTLQRGYSIITDENNSIIKNIGDAQPGQIIKIQSAEGRATASVVESEKRH